MEDESQREPSFEQFMIHLKRLGESDEAISYADEYIAAHDGMFPIIEKHTAHFVCRASSNRTIALSAEWNGWTPQWAIMKSIGGGLQHYQHDFEMDARLDYRFVEISKPDMPSFCDPLNPRRGKSGFGDASELAMPEYQRPVVTVRDERVPQGTLTEGTIKSKALRQQRPYTVYLPHGYSEHGVPYPSIYFHDGYDYLTMGEVTTILDNLIAQGSLPPLVAVFVPPIERDREYNCSDVFTSFFCDELVPEMQSLYALDVNPACHCVVGPSLGGLISLYMASRRPDTFRMLCAQSTATGSVYGLDKYNALTTFDATSRLPLRIALVIGSYESCFRTTEQGNCWDLLTSVRELRDKVDEHDYPYYYNEPHQSHSWGLWRDSLADALIYLFEEQ